MSQRVWIVANLQGHYKRTKQGDEQPKLRDDECAYRVTLSREAAPRSITRIVATREPQETPR